MIEVYKNLFVGSREDWENIDNIYEWKILQVSHKIHQEVKGYKRGCDKNDPEYYFCIKDNRMILNVIDNNCLNCRFADGIIDTIKKGVEFIYQNINDFKILVHCDQGQSRAPTVALLYLIRYTNLYKNVCSLDEIVEKFREKCFCYNPAGQMKEVLQLIYNEKDNSLQ